MRNTYSIQLRQNSERGNRKAKNYVKIKINKWVDEDEAQQGKGRNIGRCGEGKGGGGVGEGKDKERGVKEGCGQ